jgi:hypothetical protein
MLTQEIVTQKTNNLSQLYDEDFYLWIEATVNLLKTRQVEQLDYDNLIDEIESMGKSDKRSIASNLEVVLMHLLKWQYQPEKRSNSWKFSIREHRKRIIIILKDSPSLKRYLSEIITECYRDARKEAAYETGLSIDTFPVDCIFTQEEILNLDYLPD